MNNVSIFENIHINNIVEILNNSKDDSHLEESVQIHNMTKKIEQYIIDHKLEKDLTFKMFKPTEIDFKYKEQLKVKIIQKNNDDKLSILESFYYHKTPNLYMIYNKMGDNLKEISMRKIIKERDVGLIYITLWSSGVDYSINVSLSIQSEQVYNEFLTDLLGKKYALSLSIDELNEMKRDMQPVIDFALFLKKLTRSDIGLYQKFIENITYNKSFSHEEIDLINLKCDVDFSLMQKASFLPCNTTNIVEYKIKR